MTPIPGGASATDGLPEDPAPRADVGAALDQHEAEARASITSTVGAEAPEADDGLDPHRVTHLAEVLGATLGDLTDGEVPIDVPVHLAEGPVTRLPPEIYTALVATSEWAKAMVAQGVKAAKPYVFEPQALASSDSGLVDAIDLLMRLQADERVHRAIRKTVGQGTGGGGPAPSVPKAPTPTDPYKGLY